MFSSQTIMFRDSALLPARTSPSRQRRLGHARTAIFEGFAVPYGQPTGGGGCVEEFAPGAFAEWIRGGNTAPLLLFGENVGRGVFHEDAAGLWGRFTFSDTPDAQEAAQIAAQGLLGLKVRFQNRASLETCDRDGVHITRTKARLVSVSLALALTKVGETRVLPARRRPRFATARG
jgi:HK97 family phage prohead protease